MTNINFKANIALFLKKYIFLLLSIFTLIYAMFMPDRLTIGADYYNIITSPSYLTHDFFKVGGIAATFLNIALHFLLAFFLVSYRSGGKLNGLQIASVGFYCGHAFFGSHILNILPPILGVYLYAKWVRQPFRNYAPMAIFSNSLGPMVSIIWSVNNFSVLGIIMGVTVGIIAGFISVPLAERFVSFHNGLTLLNYGFTAGLIGIFFNALLSIFNINVPLVAILHENMTIYATIYLSMLFSLLLIGSLINWTQVKSNYRELLQAEGRAPADFTLNFGYSTAMFNMALMGFLCLIIVLMIGFPINGTTIGAIFSVVAFSAFGAHPFNTVPVFVGVLLGGFISQTPINSQGVVLPLLFGMGLAPVSGHYGPLAGMVAGFLHFNFVSKGLLMHAGSILYNNGFSTGMVAVFIDPVISAFKRKQLENTH